MPKCTAGKESQRKGRAPRLLDMAERDGAVWALVALSSRRAGPGPHQGHSIQWRGSGGPPWQGADLSPATRAVLSAASQHPFPRKTSVLMVGGLWRWDVGPS